MVKLFLKNSNLCDHNSPTSQTDGRTGRQTTCDRNTALCTKVHRAVKIQLWWGHAVQPTRHWLPSTNIWKHTYSPSRFETTAHLWHLWFICAVYKFTYLLTYLATPILTHRKHVEYSTILGITARCYAQRGIAMAKKSSVRLWRRWGTVIT